MIFLWNTTVFFFVLSSCPNKIHSLATWLLEFELRTCSFESWWQLLDHTWIAHRAAWKANPWMISRTLSLLYMTSHCYIHAIMSLLSFIARSMHWSRRKAVCANACCCVWCRQITPSSCRKKQMVDDALDVCTYRIGCVDIGTMHQQASQRSWLAVSSCLV